VLSQTATNRIGEIDALRGMAIILMVIFHTIVDLTDLYGYAFNYHNGFWYYESKCSASLFIFLAGLSATLTASSLRRGSQLVVWGFTLTVITWLYSPDWYIRFGILHFLGISLLTYPLLKKQKPGALLLLSIIAFAIGCWAAQQIVPWSILLPLGLMPAGFQTMDYYPLFPWYSVFLLGVAAGKRFYSTKNSLYPGALFPRPLTSLGRYSLVIYLLHQPLLLVLLYYLHRII
jgi:uncharacterized membrane protein